MTARLSLAQRAQSQRLDYVDALRGLAAFTVLFHHTTTLFPSVYAGLAIDHPALFRVAMFVSNRNYEAVLLFFVLSGFSIRLSTGRTGLATSADVCVYLYRRFRRILPLYLGALALTALLAAVDGGLSDPEFSLRVLAGNLLFLQTPESMRGTWFVPYGGNGPLWSLSYEIFYYLLFPILVFGRASFRISNRKVSFACAVGLSVLGLALFHLAPCPPFAFLALLGVWYCGVDLAELYLSAAQDGRIILVCLIACAMTVIASIPWLPSATMQSWATGCAIYCFWRVGLSLPKHAIMMSGTLWHPFLRFGLMSYAVYLFHYPLLSAATARGQTLPILATAIGLVFVIAWAGERIAARLTVCDLWFDWARRRDADTACAKHAGGLGGDSERCNPHL